MPFTEDDGAFLCAIGSHAIGLLTGFNNAARRDAAVATETQLHALIQMCSQDTDREDERAKLLDKLGDNLQAELASLYLVSPSTNNDEDTVESVSYTHLRAHET